MGTEPFSFTIHRGEEVRISWGGRCIMTVGGARGRMLCAQLSVAAPDEVQRLLQGVTDNFKRGNERPGRPSRRVRTRPRYSVPFVALVQPSSG